MNTYIPIPKPQPSSNLFEINVMDLHPTQMCVGLTEVGSRKQEFYQETSEDRVKYLKGKPVPLVKNGDGDFWMLDRHHRLRALIELERTSKAYGYIVDEVKTKEVSEILSFLQEKGWLYLFNSKGIGPQPPQKLPKNLLNMEDDPYRSLVWKLKKEGFIKPQPLIPYIEFHWAAWLRTRPLPPFNSQNLNPALPAARRLASSQGASHLPGWKNLRN